MCGITFVFDSTSDEADLRDRSKVALSRLKHRGPDGEGLFGGSSWAMGHRRLSIIDLAGSPQPMWDPTRRHCLSYNGEVYNFRELRAELEPHWTFVTQGDTEVVLAGLLTRGQGFLDRMHGMWALALWDTEGQSLFLARDRMGKKPIYYDASPAGFACASELPALNALAARPWHEDLDSTADYLRYGYCLPGYTPWLEVREVPPGHCLRWQFKNPRPLIQPYWSLEPHRFKGTKYDAAEQLAETIQCSVKRRLVADVDVGAFLSGGVDSTLVCAIVRKVLDRPLKTFTIGFADPSYDERVYAQQAASFLKTEHFSEILPDFAPSDMEQLLRANIGMPFQDPSILPTALVSRVAAQHVKVALSGDGGDELFSGYQRYQARAILRWYTRLPKSLRTKTESLLRQFPEPDRHHSRSLLRKAHLFCDVAQRIGEESPYVAPVMLEGKLRTLVAPDIAERGHQPPNLPQATRADDLAAMMLSDALVYLPQDILVKVDRASMAASLEVRAPFLDRDVVELAFSLPRLWHRRGTRGKRMLQVAFGALLPRSTWRRRKQGFGVPLHNWFKGELGNTLEQSLREAHLGPIAANGVKTMLNEHRSNRREFGQRLWLIHSYLLWRRQNF